MKIEKFLQVSPIFAIQESFSTISKYLSPHFKNEGVNLLQGLILISLLFDQEEEVHPKVLGQVFKTSKSSISQAISYLEYQGYIKRKLGIKDARSYRILLCQEGKKCANRLITILDTLQNKFEDSLGETKLREIIQGLVDLQNVLVPNSTSTYPLRTRSNLEPDHHLSP